jgi:hypothetical protein
MSMVSATDLDQAADAPSLLLPPLPGPRVGDGVPARHGHPGGPGFDVAAAQADAAAQIPDGASVWQQAQAVWLAAGASWSGAVSRAASQEPAAAKPAAAKPASPKPAAAKPPAPKPVTAKHAPARPVPARRGRARRVLLTVVAVVLVLAAVGGGYAWFTAGRLGLRSYPATQTAPLALSRATAARVAAGAGVFQGLAQVASSGGTVVAVGRQSGGDLTRAQFLVSTDGGNTWQVAPVHAASGGDPAPGHPAQLVTAGPDGWLAVGPNAIWTSRDGTSWTLAQTTGIAPTDSGDQVRMLIRTATGYLAAGQNTAQGAGVIWTSPDGLHWHRETAAQPLLEIRHGHGTVVDITGVAAHGPDVLMSGQISPWYEYAGPRAAVAWLSTDSGRTWKSVSVPTSNGAASTLAGVAAAGTGFVAVRPTAAGPDPGGPNPGGVVYASANGSSWHYVTTLTAPHGLKLTAVNGGTGGYSVLGQGPGGATHGYTSTDGTHWSQAGSFGTGSDAVTSSAVTGRGILIAAGASSTKTSQSPFLTVATPGHPPRPITVTRIAGATISPVSALAVAVAGRQQVVVGEAGGTLAAWSGPAGTKGTPGNPGTWATATGAPPAAAGTQRLTSVVDGPAGWLAAGYAQAGDTTSPVVASSADGHTWQLAQDAALTAAHGVTVQAAADRAGYVIVGRATSPAGLVPAAWWSANLLTWNRAPLPAGAGQLLAVTSTAADGSFVAVGRQGIDPAVWTSANGQHWTAHALKITGTGATAELTKVAARGRTVVAFGQETWDTGRSALLAEVSHDGGRTWVLVPVSAPRSTGGAPATVTAVTAMSDGFTAVGGYGQAGDRDVAVWTSANGNSWLTQAPRGAGLSGPGVQRISGLTATGTALTGVGFTATATGERATLWPVPARK